MKLISVAEAMQKKPSFQLGWTHTTSGNDWMCKSDRYGTVASAVVADDVGNPLFDRPVYAEAAHIITVPWCEVDARILIGLILEDRPHGANLYWGVPRGFQKFGETPETAARREAGEEAGAAVVLGTRTLGRINPNPTFVSTTGPVIALKVDRDRLEDIRPGRNEKIYKVCFFSIEELFRHLANGEPYDGGVFEDGVSLAALFMFAAHLPALVLST